VSSVQNLTNPDNGVDPELAFALAWGKPKAPPTPAGVDGGTCVHGLALNRRCEDCAHDDWASQFSAEEVAQAEALRAERRARDAKDEAERMAALAEREANLKAELQAIRARWAAPTPPAVPLVPEQPVERGVVLTSNLAPLFSGFVYVQDVHQMATPDGTMLSQSQFDTDKRFAGRLYPLTVDGSKNTDSAWEAFTQSQIAVFPQVRGTRFDPRQAEGAIVTVDKIDYVNIWRDPHVRSVPGDASRFAKHVKTLLPNGDDALILLCYMAACVQYRGVKAKWAPFIQGLPGNGKSLLGEKVMKHALGHNYVIKARSKSLDSQFNASFYGSLLVLVDDVKVKGDVFEALKPMVTDETMQIEAKGVNAVTREVCFNFIFTANPKDGLKKTADDRRICPLFCAQQEPGDLARDGLTQEYFKGLFDWLDHEDGLAIVTHYLQHFEIDTRYNFAAGCVRAPHTTSTEEAVQVGHGAARQRVQELIDAEDTDGLKGGWVNWTTFKRLLDADTEGRHMPPGARRDLLTQMGYVRHPGLNPGTNSEGQVANKLPDGSKPYLWIKRGHADARYTGNRVAQYYLAAQAGNAPPPPEAT
jgi:Family of unknown function (DUF5906)